MIFTSVDLTSGAHCKKCLAGKNESTSVYLKCVVGRAFGEAIEHCVVAEVSERPIITQEALSLAVTTKVQFMII